MCSLRSLCYKGHSDLPLGGKPLQSTAAATCPSDSSQPSLPRLRNILGQPFSLILSYDCANQGWLSAVFDLGTSGYLQPREFSQAIILCILNNETVTVKYSNTNLTCKYNLIARRFLQSVENMKTRVEEDKARFWHTFSVHFVMYFFTQDFANLFYNIVSQTAEAHWKGKKQEAKEKKSLKQLHSQTKSTYVYISSGSSLSFP